MRVISGRVDKWKHLLYEVWGVNSVEIAVLAELLLRGPQTEGELRGRASRMEEIADLDALRKVLAGLRDRGLVVYLTPGPPRHGCDPRLPRTARTLVCAATPLFSRWTCLRYRLRPRERR